MALFFSLIVCHLPMIIANTGYYSSKDKIVDIKPDMSI